MVAKSDAKHGSLRLEPNGDEQQPEDRHEMSPVVLPQPPDPPSTTAEARGVMSAPPRAALGVCLVT